VLYIGYHHHLCHLLLQQNPEWYCILVLLTQVIMEYWPLTTVISSPKILKVLEFSFENLRSLEVLENRGGR